VEGYIVMCKYKIVVAYDGTDYCGWQKQSRERNVPTVCQTLEDSFYSVFSREISIVGASRTDAGVHALGQVAQFCTDLCIAPDKMLQAWTNKLPRDIAICSFEPVEPEFNPHYNIEYKVYRYYFFVERPLPLVQRYGFFCRFRPDFEKLQAAVHVFEGTHDFRSFCTGDEHETTVRTIISITLNEPEPGKWCIEFRGPGFLRYMIRRIVGACLFVAARPEVPITTLHTVLDQKNPEHTLPNAPARGLVLERIVYKDKA
jgi:tRNA pseudouridine38-40 synthase